jgi:hypothetical protein
MTEKELEEREYERIEVQIAYEEFVKACSRAGGVASSKGKVRTWLDLKMVGCVSQDSIAEALRGLQR